MSLRSATVGRRRSCQARGRHAIAPTEGRAAAAHGKVDWAPDRFAHQAAWPSPPNRSAFDDLISLSRPLDGRDFLSPATSRWLDGLENQLPQRFWVHRDAPSRQAAEMLGARAFTRNNHIFLGNCPADEIEGVLRHELVHVAQAELALRSGRVASPVAIESEACAISGLPVARPVRSGAAPDRIYRFVWFVAIGVGLYILLRPGVANAPAPGGKTYARPSMTRITAEAICLFAVPGGAFSLGGKLGLGFLASSALAGAVTNVSLRVVDDVSRGSASPPLMYLFDTFTGATIGFIVPGGVRLIGRAGAAGFDALATYGLAESDIALTRMLAEEAAKAPLVAADAQRILQQRGLAGRVSEWWLNRRGMILLYRGQEMATNRILSPLARQQNVAASEALVARLRQEGLSYEEIAGYTARWHTQPVPAFAAPPGLANVPLGSVGIPTTSIPGIAANFGEGGGVIYIIRIPAEIPLKPIIWQGLAMEDESIILNQVPQGAIVQAIPASRVAPLMVDENGLLVPGTRSVTP